MSTRYMIDQDIVIAWRDQPRLYPPNRAVRSVLALDALGEKKIARHTGRALQAHWACAAGTRSPFRARHSEGWLPPTRH